MRIAAHPGLYDPTTDAPSLTGSRCRACGRVAFPAITIGCDQCGAEESTGIRCSGSSERSIPLPLVFLHQGDLDPPFTIGEVQLDAGPLIRVTMASVEPEPSIGETVHAIWHVAKTDEQGDASRAGLRRSHVMPIHLGDLRTVSVVGVGLHPYQRPSEVPYTALGVHAIRAALADAGLAWSDVESAYTGTATTAMGMSRLMYRHLGSTGIPMAQVENAPCASDRACLTGVHGGRRRVGRCGDCCWRGQAAARVPTATSGGSSRPGRVAHGALHPFRITGRKVHVRPWGDRAVCPGCGEEQYKWINEP